ncbi:MAG TPA: SNF2-related protein [Candidatus Limnocylindrales bacterium]|nr:SNF2-related protein [Candidatus Limnocylindrales bacterium]
MLTWQVSPEYWIFSFGDGDQPIPLKSWNNYPFPANAYAQVLLFRELLDNGKALADETSILVPHEEICTLSTIDQQLLNLPPPYPFDIRVDASGMLQQQDFQFKWGFYEHPQGRQLFGERIGCLLKLEDGTQYLLSSQQLALCNALDEFNALPPEMKNLNGNLLRFAEIKELSAKSAAILDSYLENEQVVVPKNLSLKPKIGQGDTLEILPEVEGVNARQFEEKFDFFHTVQAVYTLQDEKGKRTRIPFSEPQQQELKKIKTYRRVQGDQKRKILEQPQEIFDPDIIDLDQFSKRVIDIGLYKPRFYTFISPYKSQWIPGILIEASNGDKKKIGFRSPAELKEFKRLCEKALQEGENFVEWRGVQIPLSETDIILRTAEHQFQNPYEPVQEDASRKKVLIIKENIDQLEHEEVFEKPVLSTETFHHQYSYPPNLKMTVQVLEHQEEGIAWLQSLYRDGYSGALLADDMGLGKTLQMLAFIDWHNTTLNTEDKPYLVVAPVSLLENWEKEYPKFFEPCVLKILKFYGSPLPEFLNGTHLKNRQIVLTTYETLRKQQLKLCGIDWSVVILDEAQKIKTPGTLVTNAVKALKADFKIAATGTPVENTLVDLWCIMDFVVPGLLGSAKEFAKEYQNPLKNKDIDVKQLGESLRKRIGIYIKRRLKKDILQGLPKKTQHRCECAMPEIQFQRYLEEIAQAKSIQNNATDRQNRILHVLWTLRDISDHPFLPDKQIDQFHVDKLITTSAKLQITVEILKSIQERREKVILFADRRETQRLLARVLQEKFHIRASIVNGDTPISRWGSISSKESRQQAIDRFQRQEGFYAIIMSPLAAGVGLNITAANHVIHYSRHWNPAKEDQATDRVYRIGQEKEVYVYLPMATAPNFKSFDVILDELLERKRELASVSLFPTERAEVTPEEIFHEVLETPSEIPTFRPFTLEDLDALDPYLFEAAIAVLWQKKGYQVELTPKFNDKGADIIARSQGHNILLQTKHSRNPVGDTAIGEILKSKGFYEQRYQTSFSLGIVTNQTLTQSALNLAQLNKVYVFDRTEILRFLEVSPLYLTEIKEMEQCRLSNLI